MTLLLTNGAIVQRCAKLQHARVAHGAHSRHAFSPPLPETFQVPDIAASWQRTAYDRDVAIISYFVAHNASNLLHRRKVIQRSHREARLNDVYAQFREVSRNFQLFSRGERRAWRLLAISQRCVEDAHVVGVVDAPGYVLRPRLRRRRRRRVRSNASALPSVPSAARRAWRRRRGGVLGRLAALQTSLLHRLRCNNATRSAVPGPGTQTCL